MSGAAIRAEFGDEWTGPRRIRAFRKYGHENLIKASYDRQEAAKAREQGRCQPRQDQQGQGEGMIAALLVLAGTIDAAAIFWFGVFN
jgi:hypothetical protein